jgi:hypothetical protein
MFFYPEEYRFSSECVYNTRIGELVEVYERKEGQEILRPLFNLIIEFVV